jgi:CheY-like chemotaxis protein/anti-sigma regulatory factor (Ser/Thr protein kinase)
VAPVGLRVDGDPQRLAQVFANLLANAARYTQPGGRIEISAAAAGEGEVVVRVRDNGSGIPADVLPHVFDLFVQGEPRSAQLRGGLGIGLAIVRSLVALHGGSVSASSEGPGRGSELVVRLPRSAAAVGVEPIADAGPWSGASAGGGQRILVVDDNRDAADLLAEALRRDGYRVRVAYDGPMALAAATELEPDVALLDIGLPVQDGYEVARQLRDLLQRPALPLIAVSGYAFPADQARSREAGFHAHLVKPLEITALRSVLVSLLAGESAGWGSDHEAYGGDEAAEQQQR